MTKEVSYLEDVGTTMLGNAMIMLTRNFTIVRDISAKEAITEEEDEQLKRIAFLLHGLCALVHPYEDFMRESFKNQPEILDLIFAIVNKMRNDGALHCQCDKCKEFADIS